MGKFRVLLAFLFGGLIFVVPEGRGATATNLVFDALTKEFVAKVGEMTAEFDFSVTNTGPETITVQSVRASCGCTTPKLPALPWELKSGEHGTFHVTTDLRGKFGTFQKSVMMQTTEGMKMVYVKITVPTNGNGPAVPGMDSRTRNMQLSQADRQIVFRNDCATCHAKPAQGKTGEALFEAACAICHVSEHRASLVPDLAMLKQPPTQGYWDAWIRNGKIGTMMPGFAQSQGGPLTDEQIQSLVDYLLNHFPQRATTAVRVPGPLVGGPRPAQPIQIPDGGVPAPAKN